RSILRLRLWATLVAALSAATIQAQPAVTPTIAIIIDDVGYRRAEALRLIDIPAPITLSFLPHQPHTRDLAHQANAAGNEMRQKRNTSCPLPCRIVLGMILLLKASTRI